MSSPHLFFAKRKGEPKETLRGGTDFHFISFFILRHDYDRGLLPKICKKTKTGGETPPLGLSKKLCRKAKNKKLHKWEGSLWEGAGFCEAKD